MSLATKRAPILPVLCALCGGAGYDTHGECSVCCGEGEVNLERVAEVLDGGSFDILRLDAFRTMPGLDAMLVARGYVAWVRDCAGHIAPGTLEDIVNGCEVVAALDTPRAAA